nr:Ig-like domain-containing protein [Motilibacter aurantiacus]
MDFRVSDGLALSTGSNTVTLSPSTTSQTITFPSPVVAAPGSTVASDATASSGLPVTLTSKSPAICAVDTLDPTTIDALVAGACTVEATQDGDGTYGFAPPVELTFPVSTLAGQSITFPAPGTQQLATGAPQTFASGATADSGLPVTLASYTPSVCTVSGLSIRVAATGPCKVRATQPGNGTYAFATPVERVFDVVLATYAVTYDANGGTGTTPTTSTFSAGGSTTVAGGAALSRAGYSFQGWNTAADGSGTSYAAGATYSTNANVTLYARWAPVYTVSYDANGGAGAPVSASFTAGGSVTVASGSGVTYAGRAFTGWNTAADGSGTAYAAGSTYNAGAHATLYAQWHVLNIAPAYTGAGSNTAQTVVLGDTPAGLAATDADNDPLTYTRTGGVLPAGVTLGSGGAFSGTVTTPGVYVATVTVADGRGGTADTTLTVTVVAAGAPTVGPDTATTPVDAPVTTDVLANDTDPAGYPLTVTGITQPGHGSAVLGTGGRVTYTAATGWSGNDSYTYTVDNGRGGIAVGTVSVSVTPRAADDSAVTPAETPVTIDVLANDVGTFDRSSVTVTKGPRHGTTVVGSGGNVVYTPAFGHAGDDAFTYTALDGAGRAVAANVTVVTTPPAVAAPTSLSSSGTGSAQQTGGVSIPRGGSAMLLDAAGNPAIVVTVPGEGTYALDTTTGTITFVPAPGFTGVAKGVRFRVTDAYNQVASATYVPNVVPAPAAPVVLPPVSAGTSAPKRRTIAESGSTVPVSCSVSNARIDRCAVTLFAHVNGEPTVTGRGAVKVAAVRSVRYLNVPVKLTALGRALAAQPGGREMSVVSRIARRGGGPTLVVHTRTKVVAKDVLLVRPVYFDTDSSVIRPADRRYLDGLRTKLTGVRTVTCIGSTDSRDTTAYNVGLGKRRAVSVCTFLLEGLDADAVTVTQGETSPIATNATARGRQLNRRTDIRLGY